MKREDLRIGQTVQVTMVGVVKSIGVRVGIDATNDRNFGVSDVEAIAEYVEAFEPDKEDEHIGASGK